MPRTEAMKRAQHKYQQKSVKTIGVKLHNVLDADIIEYLSTYKSKQGKIKQLIRSEIYKDDYNQLLQEYSIILDGKYDKNTLESVLEKAYFLSEKGVIPVKQSNEIIKKLESII